MASANIVMPTPNSPEQAVRPSSNPWVGASRLPIVPPPLDASKNTREIIRLFQCQICSRILKKAVTLPCGNSLCSQCIPEPGPRTDITYPPTRSHLEGFQCPFENCNNQHTVEDYAMNVVIQKIMEKVKKVMKSHGKGPETCPPLYAHVLDLIMGAPPRGRTIYRGKLFGTYELVRKEGLLYDSKVAYSDVGDIHHGQESRIVDASLLELEGLFYGSKVAYSEEDGWETRITDAALLERLKEATRPDMDCSICYGVFLDPVTTRCGHTFCRMCFHQIFVESFCCPFSRKPIALSSGVSPREDHADAFLTAWIGAFCHDDILAKMELVDQEPPDEDLYVPLFVDTILLPPMIDLYRIKEARYARMIRWVIQNRNQNCTPKFGMVLPNLGHDKHDYPFYQYGVLLQILLRREISNVEWIIEVQAVSRFRVLAHSVRDNYYIAKIEIIGDVSMPREEALELMDMAATRSAVSLDPVEAPLQDPPQYAPHDLLDQGSNIGGGEDINGDTIVTDAPLIEDLGVVPSIEDLSPYVHDLDIIVSDAPSIEDLSDDPPFEVLSPYVHNLDALTTQELLDYGRRYAESVMAQLSVEHCDWLLLLYGDCPRDAALFSWWFASVAPTSEGMKYFMLLCTSARTRLKICVFWIFDLMQKARYVSYPRSIERRRKLLKNQANVAYYRFVEGKCIMS